MQVFTTRHPKNPPKGSPSSSAVKVNLQLPGVIGHPESLHNDAAGRRRIKSTIIERMRLLERRTRHARPVPLRIRRAGDRISKRSPLTRPSGLSDPHLSARVHLVHTVLYSTNGIEEDLVRVRDRLTLPVGVPVCDDEVAGFGDDV